MMNLSTPQDLVRDPIKNERILKPFEMPAGKGKKEVYIVKVKDDAPFEFETIAGETISKRKFSSDYGLLSNEGSQKTVLQTFSFSENQLKAYRARIEEMEKTIYDKEEKKHKIIKVAPWIEIMTVDELRDSLLPASATESLKP